MVIAVAISLALICPDRFRDALAHRGLTDLKCGFDLTIEWFDDRLDCVYDLAP